MERKTTHALLLSLAVVAGGVMMTTDAYAQTNTERLITAVDNTNSILDALAALADAVSSGFASVMASLGMIQADTESIQEELGHVESGLEGLSSDVSDINSNVDDVKEDVAGLSADVSDINSNVASVKDDVSSVKNDVSSLSALIAGSGSQLSTLTDSVTSNAASINALTTLVEQIQGELMSAAETVVTVNSTTTSIEAAVTAEEAATARAIVQLLPGTTFGSVTVADFGAGVTSHPFDNVYTSVNSLICNNDVFVQTVEATDDNTVLTVGSPTPTDHAESTVTVNGRLVFAASLLTAANTVVEVQAPVDLSNTFLPAGERLRIVGSTDQSANNVAGDGTIAAGDLNTGITITARPPSTVGNIFPSLQQYVNATDDDQIIYTTDATANVTKAMLGEVDLYKLKITWESPDEGTLCYVTGVHETIPAGFTADDDTTDDSLSEEGEVFVGLDITTGSGVLPLESETVTCGDNAKAEITGATIEVGELSQFATVIVSAGDDSVELKFHANKTLNEAESDDLPFKFTGSATVNGTATSSLLVQLDYATVKDQSCRAS